MENGRVRRTFKSVRSKASPLYADLVNLRLERRWDGLDALQRVRSKFGDSGKFLDLAFVERSLDEVFAAGKPGTTFQVPEPSQSSLESVLDTLRGLADPLGDPPSDWFTLEARLLLAKLLFSISSREEAMAILDGLDIQDLMPDATWPIHPMRLVAECLSLKGWALQQLLSENERWREQAPVALAALQQAVDVTLVYLQELSAAVSPTATKPANANNVVVSRWMEAAVHHTPLLHLLLGDTAGAVQVLRSVLRVTENQFSKTLRLSTARQLALLLLRALQPSYSPPDVSAAATAGDLSLRLHPVLSKPDFLNPEHQAEEIVLVLTIAEGLVRKEAVQSRYPDDRSIFTEWHQQVTAVYDLAVLALATFGKASLVELLEHSMRFSFDDEHLWMQFGLALISSGLYARALLVLKQCLQQNPDNREAALLCCSLCIRHLASGDDAVGFAAALVQKWPGMARGHLALGLACGLQARQQTTNTRREEVLAGAVKSLAEAYRLDEREPLCALYYAVHLAMQRRIAEALALVLDLLQRDGTHHDALWLLVLLQTSLKNFPEALAICQQALYEYPRDTVFLVLRVEIEAITSGVGSALVTAKSNFHLDEHADKEQSELHRRLWLLFSDLFLENDQYEDAKSCFKRVRDALSPATLYFRGKLLAHDLRLADAKAAYLGALASDPSHVGCMLALSSLHMEQKNLAMAEQYIAQALAVAPSDHCAWRQRGTILRLQGEHERAADCFVNALQLESSAPVAPFTDIPLIL